ncbi:helix-turn-helix domain-containing protein [Paenibacillus lutimineralis]|uniref:AraC family transcriptional regulator n=1 Tax=Paenibacillus lutimineralis TaxID=2707005 RepID=A0A3S9UZG6_9BACL|nr:helix-turn-helix domain-containing protein [Paenibacillus lutimineralis]AZS15670.1 AraC family transcriptional regulator [Paenibacillus lutimineralis]
MPANTQKPSMGVLNLQRGEKRFNLSRYPAAEALSYFVKHYWIVSWESRDEEPFLQHVVPNPCVNLVVEPGKTLIYAPSTQKFTYPIYGQGLVFGVKFKPGGFYPFLKHPISSLINRPLEVSGILDTSGLKLEEKILSLSDEQAMAAVMDKLLLSKLPLQDEQVLQINRIIDYIAEEKDLSKVDAVCEHFQIHIRKLQRLFDQYVGISPKWVIRLYRLQNAAEMIDRRTLIDLSQLGMELGYHDQSHFIRDFKAVVGYTPDEYRRIVCNSEIL